MEESVPSLDRLFIPPPSSVDYDAATEVGDESDDEANVEQTNRELRFAFENKMRKNVKMRSHCHSKVAVLLIDWDKKSEGYLDTKREVDRLRVVFKSKYHFKTRRRRLNTDLPQSVHKQMQKHLVDFQYELDSEETLLIIYYGGHGTNDKTSPDTLSLHGSTSKPSPNKDDHIVWNEVEELIKDTKGDILLIFDCCYAGVLARSKKRAPSHGKLFEFLGATLPDERAMGPGDHSFTTALIWALNELTSYTKGFVLQELRDKIQEAPGLQNFPDPDHHQTACIGDRSSEPAMQRLRMCALRESADATQLHREEIAQNQPARPKYYLALEFLFSSRPTEQNINFLCKQIQNLLATENYPLQHVLWRALSLKPRWKERFPDVVHRLMQHRKSTISLPSTPNMSAISIRVPGLIPEPRPDKTPQDPYSFATSLAAPGELIITPEEIRLRDLGRPGKARNYLYATSIVRKRSWVLLSLLMFCILMLGYVLLERRTWLLPSRPS